MDIELKTTILSAVSSNTPFAVSAISLSTGFSLLPETALETCCPFLKKPTGEGSPPSLRALSQRLDNTSACVFSRPVGISPSSYSARYSDQRARRPGRTFEVAKCSQFTSAGLNFQDGTLWSPKFAIEPRQAQSRLRRSLPPSAFLGGNAPE
jgi:hypothetical protein